MRSKEPDALWSARELAAFLNYRESSISSMLSKRPDRLPPRVAALGRPRWSPEVVRAWVKEQTAAGAAVAAPSGRPRRTVSIDD